MLSFVKYKKPSMCPLVLDSSLLLATTHIGQPFLRCNFRFKIVLLYEELMAAVEGSPPFSSTHCDQIRSRSSWLHCNKNGKTRFDFAALLLLCCGLEMQEKDGRPLWLFSLYKQKSACGRFKHHSSNFMCLDEIELRAWTSNADFSQGKNKEQKSLLAFLLSLRQVVPQLYIFPLKLAAAHDTLDGFYTKSVM